jgi:hypothetical protein
LQALLSALRTLRGQELSSYLTSAACEVEMRAALGDGFGMPALWAAPRASRPLGGEVLSTDAKTIKAQLHSSRQVHCSPLHGLGGEWRFSVCLRQGSGAGVALGLTISVDVPTSIRQQDPTCLFWTVSVRADVTLGPASPIVVKLQPFVARRGVTYTLHTDLLGRELESVDAWNCSDSMPVSVQVSITP